MAEPFVSSTRLAELTQQLAAGTPMSPIYISPEDSMRVTILNSHPTTEYECCGRLLRADGVTVPLVQTLLKRTDGVASATIMTLAEGYLLSVVVVPLNGFAQRGECFGMVDLIRGQTTSAKTFAVLATGYVSSLQPLIWPWGARNESENALPGAVEIISGSPAIGTQFVYTVPANKRVFLRTLSWSVTTSATAGDRIVHVALLRSGVNVFAVMAAEPQTAGLNWSYSVGATINTHAMPGGTHQELSWPIPMALLPGMQIFVNAVGLLATDKIENVMLTLESLNYWGSPV